MVKERHRGHCINLCTNYQHNVFTLLVLDINWFTHNAGERALKLVSQPNRKLVYFSRIKLCKTWSGVKSKE